MRKKHANAKVAAVLSVFLVLFICRASFGEEQPDFPLLTLSQSDRVLVLAPHPDDEVLACSSVIEESAAKKIPIRVVFFTYGDNNQWSFLLYRKHLVIQPGAVRAMGLVRHDEAVNADGILGLAKENQIFLGYPDFGTLNIWNLHWGDEPPFKSMLTKCTSVPYDNAYRPGAQYRGEEVLKDLESIIGDFKPTKIFVSHPADHNIDHRALYLFTRIALWNLGKQDKFIQPEVFPFLVHFRKWPRPSGLFPDKFLEPPDYFKDKIEWKIRTISKEGVVTKDNALKAHKSQYKSSVKYLSSFIRRNELYGNFPEQVLVSGAPMIFVAKENVEGVGDISEELTDMERAVFVGLEERGVQIDKDNLIISIDFSRPLAKEVSISVYAFGYRDDVPFEKMPKIHIKYSAMKRVVYNKKRSIAGNNVRMVKENKKITIYIPLDLLGRPQKIMTSANSYMAKVPLDWISWRIFTISGVDGDKK